MLDRIDRCKAALDAVRPFEGDTLKELRDYYKIGLTWSTNTSGKYSINRRLGYGKNTS